MAVNVINPLHSYRKSKSCGLNIYNLNLFYSDFPLDLPICVF